MAQITRTGITVFLYHNKTIGSPGYLKSPTLASHSSIKVGCWLGSHRQPLLPTIRSSLPRIESGDQWFCYDSFPSLVPVRRIICTIALLLCAVHAIVNTMVAL